jgi:hypothetical protein
MRSSLPNVLDFEALLNGNAEGLGQHGQLLEIAHRVRFTSAAHVPDRRE